MSKGLKKAFRKICRCLSSSYEYTDEFKKNKKLIETALENYEELTSKPYILCGRTHGETQKLINTICKIYKKVKIINLEDKNKVKALEIINEKNVDVGAIKVCINAYSYNDFKELTESKLVKRKSITQEEFELIKKEIKSCQINR